MNTSTLKRFSLFLMLLLNISVAMADSDVSVELRQQNTPSGWQAVQLPNIAAITSTNTFNITSYGASTSNADNSSAINQAITAANVAGGGMVVIPSGTWLSGPITMKSNVVLHMSKNCTLKVLPFKGKMQNVSAGEPYYPVTGWTETVKDGKTTYSSTLVNFINNDGKAVNDIIIEGEGETSVIDGQGEPWWKLREEIGDYTRPNLIRIEKGARHLFRNFKTHNAVAQNIVLGRSGGASNITVHGITIDNPSSEASTPSHNTDGFPIWGPYVNIYDCNISTGDDNIVCDSKAHHIHAWNITCGDGHGMSIGSYTSELHDVIYEGITFNGTGSGFRIKTNSDRSGNDQTGTNGAVKNIICRNATMTGCPSPIKITSWYDKDIDTPSNNPTSTVSATTPEFCDILFQNITATAVSGKTSWKHNRPIYLYGRPEMYIHDVTFDNVKINSVLGMFMAFAKNITFKNGCKIVNEKTSGSLLTTEYLAYSDNGSTLLSANASKYNGSESTTTYPVTFKNGSTTYKTYNICPNSYAYPPTEPTKAGTTFLGWATSEGGTPVTLAQTQLAAGGTFYAVWDGEEQGGGNTGGEDVSGPIFSLQVNSGKTLSLAYQESSQLTTEATITGGTATVYNGKNSETAQNMVSSGGSINLGGSSGSYLLIHLNGNTFKAGDVITVTNAGNYKITNTNSNSSASTVTFPYTVTASDAINGKSDLYIWKTGTTGDPSTINTITVTRGSDSGDDGDGDDDEDKEEEVTIGLTTTTSTTSGAEGTGATWTGATGITVTEANGSSATTYKTGDKGVNYGSETANYSLYAYRITTKQTDFQTNEYAGYKVEVADGYSFTLTNIDALMYASANVTWKVIVEDGNGNSVYTSNSTTPSNYKAETGGFSITDSEINKKLTGTFYVKVYYYFNGTGKYLCFPKLKIGGIVKYSTPTPLTLDDSNDYETFAEGTYDVTLTRSIPTGEWSTLVVPFDVTLDQLIEAFPDPDNSSIAKISRFVNNSLYIIEDDHIEANVPVFIKLSETNADNKYTFKGVTIKNGTAKYIADGVSMVGVYKTVSNLGSSRYFIYDNKFYDCTYMSSMKPFRAYFEVNGSNAKLSSLALDNEDVATGITNVRNIQVIRTDKPLYNIAGQRVRTSAKGLLIQDGIKLYIK